MIDPAKLTKDDVGRSVLYYSHEGAPPDRGTLSSWNDKYIFARFTSGSTAAACDPADLAFEFQKPSAGL